MQGLTEGRIVHFVLDKDQHRPAVIVKVWSKETGTSNLQVFVDGTNDKYYGVGLFEQIAGMMWRTSVVYSEEPKVGTWHWIEPA